MSEEMNRYLWDGSGEADADVARIETVLQRYRFRRGAAACQKHFCCFAARIFAMADSNWRGARRVRAADL